DEEIIEPRRETREPLWVIAKRVAHVARRIPGKMLRQLRGCLLDDAHGATPSSSCAQGGSAPGRDTVIAAARVAKRNAARKVPSSSPTIAGLDSRPARHKAVRSPAENVSPAPTVSAILTG